MAKPTVLDASAVLAWLQQEDGADVVDPLLDGGIMSAANWSEVLQKVEAKGVDPEATAASLKVLGVQVTPVTEQDAAAAAHLWFMDPNLALGDRFCLALAQRLGGQAVTADQLWGSLPEVDVLVIR